MQDGTKETYADHMAAATRGLQNGDASEADQLADSTVRQLSSNTAADAILAALLTSQEAWEDFVPLYLLPLLSSTARTHHELLEPLAILVRKAASQCSPRDLGVVVLGEWSLLHEHHRHEVSLPLLLTSL